MVRRCKQSDKTPKRMPGQRIRPGRRRHAAEDTSTAATVPCNDTSFDSEIVVAALRGDTWSRADRSSISFTNARRVREIFANASSAEASMSANNVHHHHALVATFATKSGITTTPRAANAASAWAVVGTFAASTTSRARTWSTFDGVNT